MPGARGRGHPVERRWQGSTGVGNLANARKCCPPERLSIDLRTLPSGLLPDGTQVAKYIPPAPHNPVKKHTARRAKELKTMGRQ
jgi:hypothetical protein